MQGSELNVPPHIGLSHHYRGPCSEGGFKNYKNDAPMLELLTKDPKNCINKRNHVDRAVYKYKEKLLRNIKRVLYPISEKCKFDHLLPNLR